MSMYGVLGVTPATGGISAPKSERPVIGRWKTTKSTESLAPTRPNKPLGTGAVPWVPFLKGGTTTLPSGLRKTRSTNLKKNRPVATGSKSPTPVRQSGKRPPGGSKVTSRKPLSTGAKSRTEINHGKEAVKPKTEVKESILGEADAHSTDIVQGLKKKNIADKQDAGSADIVQVLEKKSIADKQEAGSADIVQVLEKKSIADKQDAGSADIVQVLENKVHKQDARNVVDGETVAGVSTTEVSAGESANLKVQETDGKKRRSQKADAANVRGHRGAEKERITKKAGAGHADVGKETAKENIAEEVDIGSVVAGRVRDKNRGEETAVRSDDAKKTEGIEDEIEHTRSFSNKKAPFNDLATSDVVKDDPIVLHAEKPSSKTHKVHQKESNVVKVKRSSTKTAKLTKKTKSATNEMNLITFESCTSVTNTKAFDKHSEQTKAEYKKDGTTPSKHGFSELKLTGESKDNIPAPSISNTDDTAAAELLKTVELSRKLSTDFQRSDIFQGDLQNHPASATNCFVSPKASVASFSSLPNSSNIKRSDSRKPSSAKERNRLAIEKKIKQMAIKMPPRPLETPLKRATANTKVSGKSGKRASPKGTEQSVKKPATSQWTLITKSSQSKSQERGDKKADTEIESRREKSKIKIKVNGNQLFQEDLGPATYSTERTEGVVKKSPEVQTRETEGTGKEETAPKRKIETAKAINDELSLQKKNTEAAFTEHDLSPQAQNNDGVSQEIDNKAEVNQHTKLHQRSEVSKEELSFILKTDDQKAPGDPSCPTRNSVKVASGGDTQNAKINNMSTSQTEISGDCRVSLTISSTKTIQITAKNEHALKGNRGRPGTGAFQQQKLTGSEIHETQRNTRRFQPPKKNSVRRNPILLKPWNSPNKVIKPKITIKKPVLNQKSKPTVKTVKPETLPKDTATATSEKPKCGTFKWEPPRVSTEKPADFMPDRAMIAAKLKEQVDKLQERYAKDYVNHLATHNSWDKYEDFPSEKPQFFLHIISEDKHESTEAKFSPVPNDKPASPIVNSTWDELTNSLEKNESLLSLNGQLNAQLSTTSLSSQAEKVLDAVSSAKDTSSGEFKKLIRGASCSPSEDSLNYEDSHCNTDILECHSQVSSLYFQLAERNPQGERGRDVKEDEERDETLNINIFHIMSYYVFSFALFVCMRMYEGEFFYDFKTE